MKTTFTKLLKFRKRHLNTNLKMKIFDLPKATEFGRVIPKNYFDKFTNTKQKKLMSDYIQRMRWTNKLAASTVNLSGKSITEIQIFTVELKQKNDIKPILEIIQRAIPYHIIFVLKYDNEILLSTATKHIHPHKKDETVLDFVANTLWFLATDNIIQINLNRSLDWIFIDFCCQILGRNNEYKSYTEFVEKELEIQTLTTKINQLEKQIKRERQFNRKVALNMKLNLLKKEIESLLNP